MRGELHGGDGVGGGRDRAGRATIGRGRGEIDQGEGTELISIRGGGGGNRGWGRTESRDRWGEAAVVDRPVWPRRCDGGSGEIGSRMGRRR
jgi:hypothetical protein